MSDPLDPAHVAWCGNMFEMLADHGVWGIPRSGLIFQRQGDELVLIARMPWEDGMPLTPTELREQQDSDYDGCVAHFAAAGVTVTTNTKEVP